MNDRVHMTLEEVHALAVSALLANGMSTAHAQAIAEVITQGQRDECHSHGLYRVLVCVRSLRSGKVDPAVLPTLHDVGPSIVKVDAHQGYSLLAFQTGLPVLVEKARRQGIAALVIRNCFHFSALWPEVEAIAAHGLVGMAMTPSHSWVAPAGGKRGVFGTNPLAFAWPRPAGEPFVFDFATSAIARGYRAACAGGQADPRWLGAGQRGPADQRRQRCAGRRDADLRWTQGIGPGSHDRAAGRRTDWRHDQP